MDELSCSTGECPTLHDVALPSNIVPVRLQKTNGEYWELWMSWTKTIAEVLRDYTPTDLKNANPVIVVDGRVAMLDMFLGDFHTNGDLLLTIQRPMEW